MPERGFDLFLSRAIRTCGLGIVIWQTVADNLDRPVLLGTALSMMSGTLLYEAVRRKLAA